MKHLDIPRLCHTISDPVACPFKVEIPLPSIYFCNLSNQVLDLSEKLLHQIGLFFMAEGKVPFVSLTNVTINGSVLLIEEDESLCERFKDGRSRQYVSLI